VSLTKRLLYSKSFAHLTYLFVRSYSSTFRLRVVNEAEWRPYVEDGGRVLICVWHQQFFPLIRYFKTYRDYRPGLMISRSADGELIANVAARSGWQPVRGSSSRGGAKALSAMIDHLQQNRLAAHILDGPRGPAGVVKMGAVKLAMTARARIVPVYAETSAMWMFNSWDRFFIPRPFSRVTIRFGEMLPLMAPTTDRTVLEKERRRLEQIMRPGMAGPYQRVCGSSSSPDSGRMSPSLNGNAPLRRSAK
jgi:hypothetical protein